MKSSIEDLYQRARAIARKANLNIVIGAGPRTVIDIELYSPQLKTCDYPPLLMRQLKRRKVKEDAMERFVFKKGGLLCDDQK
jgi:hypothetical protein